MNDKVIKDLLVSHLVDVDRLTHIIKESDDYWHVFNAETMSGFEISGDPMNQYTIETWCTTSFYIQLSIDRAEVIE